MTAAQPPALYAVWLHGQKTAIAQQHDAQARAQLALVLHQVRETHSVASGLGSAQLAAAAAHELATPGRYRLHRAVVAPRASWWQLLWGWVGDRWSALIGLLTKHVRIAGPLRATIGDVLVVLVLSAIGVVAAQMLRALQFRRDRSLTDVRPLQPGRSAHLIFVRAEAAAQSGNYARAIRLLFTATVTLLDLRGALHDNASATVNELRGELGSQGDDVKAAFVAIARHFTQAAYAEHPVVDREWVAARDAYHALVRRVGTS